MNLPSRFLRRDEARALYGDQAERVGAKLLESDELADRVVEAFAALPPGAGLAMLDRALDRGGDDVRDAPPALRELLDEVDRVPAWVDPRALERGGELLFRAGYLGGVALGVSLLYGYASPAGNKPLVFSGRLEDQAARRIRETSRFVEATCAPFGLARRGDGLRITLKVRLMHAQVRRMILRSGKWDTERWGLPINQHDMAGTSILFSLGPIDTLSRVGFELDEEEQHLYMQLWRYSGRLIGVHPDILPTSVADARRLAEIIAKTQGPPDEDSRRLSRTMFASGPRSLPGTPKERARAARMADLGEGIVRAVMGEELSDALSVPRSPYRHAIHLVRAALSGVEGRPMLRRALRARQVAVGRAYWRAAVAREREPMLFSLPTELSRRSL
jgi:hypothetical protein